MTNRFDLVKNLTFTDHFSDVAGNTIQLTKTGAEWGEAKILPVDARVNIVPWVIVYEPMVCVYFDDGTPPVFLTATEFALTQGDTYNWHKKGSQNSTVFSWEGKEYLTSKLPFRAIQSLAFRNLPASVTLKENWFGYATSPVKSGDAWDASDIYSFGGWGMGFLSAAHGETDDAEGTGRTGRMEETENPAVELSVSFVQPDCGYIAGCETVSSFRVQNTGETDVSPEDGIVLRLTAKCAGKTVCSSTQKAVTVPAGEDTYIWFRWTVPVSASGRMTLQAEAVAMGDIAVNGNVCTGTVAADVQEASHTPDTGFTDTKPAGFSVTAPRSYSDTVSWHEWSWTEGTFEKHAYSATLTVACTLTPDPGVSSSYKQYGVWTMRSGYGVYADGTYALTAQGFSLRAADLRAGGSDSVSGSVTPVQTADYTFAEFLWKTTPGSHERGLFTGWKTDGSAGGHFGFPQNANAGGLCIHYTPLWYPDGRQNYHVCLTLGCCWTPGGTLEARAVSDGITIDGTLYDDWYPTHG